MLGLGAVEIGAAALSSALVMTVGSLMRGRRQQLAAETEQRILREALARAERVNEAKSRLLATVSHEFRTPLNGILGMTRLLIETGLDAEQTTYAEAVRSSAESFLGLVGDMLDMSVIEAGRIELADEPFDLEVLVQGVVELLAPRAQAKGTAIAAHVSRALPRFVRGDVDRLRQVLLNLAGNAVKFTARGGSGIRVEPHAGGIAIHVEDTGPGISPEARTRIFDEYELGTAPDDGEGSTGLGLAIARRIVDRMGGQLALDSTPGAGSRFSFTLPLRTADGAMPRDLSTTNRRVLVLSRTPFEGDYLARCLAEAGGIAAVVDGLGQAVDRLGRERFDVLLVDHGFPADDVRLATQEARRRGLSRVLVLLAPFQRRDLLSPQAAGFDGYLIKPVRARSLLQQVGEVPRLRQSETTAETRAALTPVAAKAPHAPGRRVLLVEDNEINALLAIRALDRAGGRPEWARDGQDALRRMEEVRDGRAPPFDLLLVDLNLPGLGGSEVARRVRAQQDAAGPRPRIVAFTASSIRTEEELCRDGLFDGLLLKPATPQALAALLGEGAEQQREAG